MTKEYYMLFDKDGMPAAVFLTETAEQSQKLFCTLFRRSWEKITAEGYHMEREKDVLPERWEEIYQVYKSRKTVEEKPVEPMKVIEPMNIFKSNNLTVGPLQLETAKYMPRYYKNG